MTSDTREALLSYIRKITSDYLKTGKTGSTEEAADAVHLSRSVVSKYLNHLYNQNAVVKIATRPVIYFDRKTIEDATEQKLIETEYLSLGEFESAIRNISSYTEFHKLIGKNYSLKKTLAVFRDIVDRNVKGSLLLLGDKGTGKTHLSNALLNEYAKKYSLTKRKIACTKGYQNYDEELFGQQGLLLQKDSSVLIDDIENMPASIQNKLAFKINNGQCESSLIILTAQDESMVSESLVGASFVKVALPPLHERTLNEKEKFILQSLIKYEKNKGDIRISNDALDLLCNSRFKNNITDLKKAIADAIQSASQEESGKKIVLYRYHFPITEDNNSLYSNSKDKILLSTDQISELLSSDIVIDTAEEIKKRFYNSANPEASDRRFISDIKNRIDYYSDRLMFDRKYSGDQVQTIERVVTGTLDVVGNFFQTTISTSVSRVLSRMIYENSYANTHIRNWEEANHEFIKQFDHYLMVSHNYAYSLIDEIAKRLFAMLEIRLDILSRLFLFSYFLDSGFSYEQYDVAGIIAAHGYSTASSIADSANRIIGKHIFDGIDMPIDTESPEIVNRIKEYIKARKISKEVILLVDMGSLEMIGQEIADATANRIAVINNISTKLAIVTGMDIVGGKPFDEIIKDAKDASEYSCHVVESNVKRKAIVFAFDTGIQTTERVMNVFQASLPKPIDVRFIALDYHDLNNQSGIDEISRIYDVLFIVGSLSTKINSIPCVALEDIMTTSDMKEVRSLMGNVLNSQEIEELNSNLLRNFSLENIIKNATILNPNMLMDLIEEALKKMQRELGVRFSNKVMSGLYLHISGMIERLVMKEYEIPYEDPERFLDENRQFVCVFEKCFSTIEKKYNINISVSEIAYLHDYIKNGFIYTQGRKDRK